MQLMARAITCPKCKVALGKIKILQKGRAKYMNNYIECCFNITYSHIGTWARLAILKKHWKIWNAISDCWTFKVTSLWIARQLIFQVYRHDAIIWSSDSDLCFKRLRYSANVWGFCSIKWPVNPNWIRRCWCFVFGGHRWATRKLRRDRSIQEVRY